jgi:hypothetical protein
LFLCLMLPLPHHQYNVGLNLSVWLHHRR